VTDAQKANESPIETDAESWNESPNETETPLRNAMPVLDDVYVKDVCKIGQGHECCRYLLMSPRRGWQCGKTIDRARRYFDQRVADQLMTARGDNCPGIEEEGIV
jgi:hypothetical protein